MSISQKRAGVVLSYISELIKVLSTLFYTPIMLRLLGQSEYGLYQLVQSVVSYLSLLSLGFTTSYIKYYTKFDNKGNKEDISKLNGMFLIVFLIIASIALVCGGVMVSNISSIFGTKSLMKLLKKLLVIYMKKFLSSSQLDMKQNLILM